MNPNTSTQPNPLFPRSAGILLHPVSFPSPFGIGDLGKEAYEFIDFLKRAGQHLWQILPLTPTGFGDSPYQSYSAFAGQPLLIDLRQLVDLQLLNHEDLQNPPSPDTKRISYETTIAWKSLRLKKAHEAFLSLSPHHLSEEYTAFCEENKQWLDGLALFLALRDWHGKKPWYEWEEACLNPASTHVSALAASLSTEIAFHQFVQFLFFKQWFALKTYANRQDIQIIGDLPIFVHLDSADVWLRQDLFQLDEKGKPTQVAGVPPDYFSETGQLWGNPQYNWKALKNDGYQWWIDRLKHQLKLQDYIRIDHFRGFESYWSVPASAETAVSGTWEKGPGEDLFQAIQAAFQGELPIIAEDLGIITPEVEALRDNLHFPGMKILQFAFDGDYESLFLPHRLTTCNCICYTGTHDNDTTAGWYAQTAESNRDKVRRYMNTDGSSIHMDFIRTCLGTIANFAIYPLQDVLGLGTDARMNIPGVASGNWGWRYASQDLTPELADWLASLTKLFGR